MIKRIVALAAFTAFLLGGIAYTSQQSWVYYNWTLNDAAVVTGRSSCYPALTFEDDAPDVRAVCFNLTGRMLILEEVYVVAGSTLDGNSDCELVIESNISDASSVVGTEISSSSIDIGPNNANSGKCSDVTIDGRGEGCKRMISGADAQANIPSGMWFRLKIDTGSSGCGGACTCDHLEGAQISVVGRLQ